MDLHVNQRKIISFQQEVWEYYAAHGRHDLPWRVPEADGTFDPYKILVSELMLQQTQVARVIPKYEQFLKQFPTVHDLAHAPLGDVLIAWQGLGYNRRAKFLWQAARMVVEDLNGQFPTIQKDLEKLPGVGRNTAGAISAYAYNQPVTFVETNIRTVFIHHFFQDQSSVPDKEILQVVTQTLPAENPREWYWGIMDWGVYLKQTHGNVSRHSKSYVKQSRFSGSKRQIRGRVLRLLGQRSHNFFELDACIADLRLKDVLHDLEREGMVHHNDSVYSLFQVK